MTNESLALHGCLALLVVILMGLGLAYLFEHVRIAFI